MQSFLSAIPEPTYNAARFCPTKPTRNLPASNPSIQSRVFGSLPGGEVVEAWVLTGKGGLQLECINYGGIVTRLLVPDREGELADVVLGFGSLEPYLAGTVSFGGIVGRVAGRIPGGQYRLNGSTYRLTGNTPEGSEQGYNKRLWQAKVLHRSDGAPSIRFRLTSEDGDEGHPGTVHINVTYTITHDNAFLIETEADTDRLTPLSLTHHTYFNLAGESNGTIHDHELQIYSDECVAVDDRMTPLGRVEALVYPGNDFRKRQTLGSALPYLFREHGDLYRLRMSAADDGNTRMVSAARLVHHGSGRVLDVSTSARCLQLSTASELNGVETGKSGRPYEKHAGICLECEGYPDGIGHPELGSILLRPGQVKLEASKYSFSTVEDDMQPPSGWWKRY